MLRSRRSRVAGAGLFAVVALFLLAPLASAATPPVTFTPGYHRYGGSADTGRFVDDASGNGTNHVAIGPRFVVGQGIARSTQLSEANRTGVYSISVWTGVQNISFRCRQSCATGSVNVTIVWNLTWSARLNSTCPGGFALSWVHSSAALSVNATVLDLTSSPPTVVASHSLRVFGHLLLSPGTHRDGKTQVYLEKFQLPLVHGDAYALQAYVYATTYAAAITSTTCGSSSVLKVGSLSHPSVLEGIKIA